MRQPILIDRSENPLPHAVIHWRSGGRSGCRLVVVPRETPIVYAVPDEISLEQFMVRVIGL